MPEGISKEGIGASVRKEDKKFITGKACYTDDINRAGQVYAYFVRSDVSHAEIAKINTSAAMKADGVVAIFTGEDVAADGIGGPICWHNPNRDGSSSSPASNFAQGKVRSGW